MAHCALMCESLSLGYMTITMNDSHIVSIAQLREFSKVAQSIEFKSVSKKEKYQWINNILTKFKYFSLKKKDRVILRRYMMRMAGMSKSQLTRIIAKKKKTGRVWVSSTARHRFDKIYGASDIALLIETDNAHSRLSGQATKTIFERMYQVFDDLRFKRLKNISVAHIYNLRGTRQYKSHSLTIKKTCPVKNSIGQRKKPDPYGQPGFLRVDTVHQGDYGKKKGIYHINITDEITQWEIVGAVSKISEYYLRPLLEDLIAQFPFKIINFHSDNGSEFINKVVAQLLNKLLVEQTKSRARHCNDNALAECKNGAIVRKHMGYVHIPQSFAPLVDQFYKDHLNIYLNYHRPCGFATIVTGKRGKQKKVYRQKDYQTPFDKLMSLLDAEKFLKEGNTLKELKKIALAQSDNECAKALQEAKVNLFKNFKHVPQEMIEFTTFISGSYVD